MTNSSLTSLHMNYLSHVILEIIVPALYVNNNVLLDFGISLIIASTSSLKQ
jgi:hypothetical protein